MPKKNGGSTEDHRRSGLRPPWKKGESGNKSGLSKEQALIKKLFAQVGAEIVEVTQDKKKVKMTRAEKIIRKIFDHADNDMWEAIKFIGIRYAPEKIIVENEGNAPAGTPVINFEKVFEGLKIDAKTLDKMRERYLAQLFPDRGFSKEEDA